MTDSSAVLTKPIAESGAVCSEPLQALAARLSRKEDSKRLPHAAASQQLHSLQDCGAE